MKINTYKVTITMHNDDQYEMYDYSETPRTPEPNRHGFIPVVHNGESMVFLSPGQIRDIKIVRMKEER